MSLRLVLDMDGVLFDSDELKAITLVDIFDGYVGATERSAIDRWNRSQRGVPRRAKFAAIVDPRRPQRRPSDRLRLHRGGPRERRLR